MSTVKQEIHMTKSGAAVTPVLEGGPKQHTRRSGYGIRYMTQVLLTGVPLFISDLLAITGSTIFVFKTVDLVWPNLGANPLAFLLFVSATLPVIYFLFKLYPGTGLNPIVEVRQIILATASIYTAFVAASVVHDGRQGYMALLAVACLLSMIVVALARSIIRRILSRFRWWGQPMLIFGGNSTGQKNYEYFAARPQMGLRPVGIVDDPNHNNRVAKTPSYSNPLDRASMIAERHDVFWAVVAMPDGSPTQARQIIETYAANFPHMLVVPNLVGLPTLWNDTFDCGDQLGIEMKANLLLPLPRLIKRALDLTLVIVGSLLFLPLIFLIAALIKLTSPGPAFYQQQRIGYGGRRFHIWKFRTMVKDADLVLERYLATNPLARSEWERDTKLKNDPRITRVGRWLRMTSLDELPQIWNVFTGEMGLVGPRPIVQAEIKKYQQCFDLYVRVTPGITGLWQISGRNNTTYGKRVDLDSYYVRNWSPWLDLYILARTVKVVLRREGAY
jgi:Undecaprenyl-phosphate galactose phosphotransferase WbaP